MGGGVTLVVFYRSSSPRFVPYRTSKRGKKSREPIDFFFLDGSIYTCRSPDPWDWRVASSGNFGCCRKTNPTCFQIWLKSEVADRFSFHPPCSIVSLSLLLLSLSLSLSLFNYNRLTNHLHKANFKPCQQSGPPKETLPMATTRERGKLRIPLVPPLNVKTMWVVLEHFTLFAYWNVSLLTERGSWSMWNLRVCC